MSDNQHISKNDFILFQNNLMPHVDRTKFLEHIAACDHCADQFAALMTEDIITAPKDLKANILKAVKRPEVQLAAKARETSKRMQLFIYSLKVGTATVCALLLLMLTMNIPNISTAFHLPDKVSSELSAENESSKSLTSVIRDGMNNLSNSMLDLSNNIMNTEVTDHDQKEK